MAKTNEEKQAEKNRAAVLKAIQEEGAVSVLNALIDACAQQATKTTDERQQRVKERMAGKLREAREIYFAFYSVGPGFYGKEKV